MYLKMLMSSQNEENWENMNDLGINVNDLVSKTKNSTTASKVSNQLVEKDLLDELQLIDIIRKKISEKVIVICNKCDNEDLELQMESELYQLGFKDQILISAEHGNNMHHIWEFLDRNISEELRVKYENLIKLRKKKIKQFKKNFGELVDEYLEEFKDNKKENDFDEINWMEEDVNVHKMKNKGRHLDKEFFMEEFQKLNKHKEFDSDIDDDEIPLENILRIPKLIEEKGISFDNPFFNNTIEVAIIGRPNTGKSTLINKWLGREISLIDEISHTTRDTSRGTLKVQNRRIELIDTAGLNKNLKESKSEIDKMAFYKTKKKIKHAQVHLILGRSLEMI
jgi:predicted GTPase